MRERGVITRIGERMLPDMPKCHEHTTFHTARIADVYSAFIILGNILKTEKIVIYVFFLRHLNLILG